MGKKVVILCGGMGTRIRDLSEQLPKPMIPIGGYPIVWHIMKYYASFGHTEFVLCLGYKKEAFVDYFVNYRHRNSDITVSLKNGDVVFHNDRSEDWKVTLADTGLTTDTGGRLKKIEKYVEEGTFFMTYGDGVSDIDLHRLAEFHNEKGGAVTVTAVHPSSRFGEIRIEGDMVQNFIEKPQTTVGYINGGFMVLNGSIFKEYLNDDPELDFEKVVMRAVAADERMTAFRHNGFWQCMDTSREYQLLNKLWDQNVAPWKVW
jgi:glucose-1-phosphate cytidylyltransferase